ncbi:MAG: hypothetical protein WBE27_03635 [Microgenomates group bacterium]
MKSKIKTQDVVILLGLVFWPLSLFLANSSINFIRYTLPAVLMVISLVLFKKQSKLYFLPILLIPVIEPKLVLLPIGVAIADFFWNKANKKTFAFLATALLVLVLTWRGFSSQTIFTLDYEARQAVIRKTQLYRTVFMARLFHNKARICIDKFNDKFFALTDPNNYFFGFHPRQIVLDNQNLNKFPFAALPFVLFGIYHLDKSKDKRFIINIFIASLLSLSILTIFDRNDFVLWLPISLTFIHGVKQFSKRFKMSKIFFFLFILFSIPGLIRIFVQ